MKTNQEKWDDYQAELKKRDGVFIAQELPVVPIVIYEVAPRGQIRELFVEYAGYRHLHATRLSGKKPARKDIAKIAAYLDSLVLKRDEILLFWRNRTPEYTTSGAISLKEIRESSFNRLSKEETEARSRANKAKAEHEDELLKDGHFRCAYCGNVTPDSQAVTTPIWAAQYPGGKKEFKHCSGKCAMHNQCAHEG